MRVRARSLGPEAVAVSEREEIATADQGQTVRTAHPTVSPPVPPVARGEMERGASSRDGRRDACPTDIWAHLCRIRRRSISSWARTYAPRTCTEITEGNTEPIAQHESGSEPHQSDVGP